MPGLFGDVLSRRITQHDVFYFAADGRWATPGVPGWVDYDGAAYGLGDLDGRGVKVAPDLDGPPFDAQTGERRVHPEHERFARAYLAHRFPALAGAPLIGSRVCQYEITPDTWFVVAPHPEHGGRVWLLGGGSGHAFKHGRVGRARRAVDPGRRGGRAAVRPGRAAPRHIAADGGRAVAAGAGAGRRS